MMQRMEVDILSVQENVPRQQGWKHWRRTQTVLSLNRWQDKWCVAVSAGVPDRMMNMKIEIRVVIINIVSAYVPLVGFELKENHHFLPAVREWWLEETLMFMEDKRGGVEDGMVLRKAMWKDRWW